MDEVIDLSRFKIKTGFGEGGQGHVYDVVDVTTGKEYAMKVSNKNEQALAEAKIQTKFIHPRIVDTELYFETDDKTVIIMEACRKGDLSSFISASKNIHVGQKEIVGIFTQICFAVQYIHNKGFSHRDMKASNIVNCGSELVSSWKLIDFGFAVEKDTLIFGSCCSLMYLSPESLKQEPYFPQPTDIWALGILLYEMLYRKSPFSGRTKEEYIRSIKDSTVKFPKRKVNQKVLDLIGLMLERDPEKRITINGVIEKLKDIWGKKVDMQTFA